MNPELWLGIALFCGPAVFFLTGWGLRGLQEKRRRDGFNCAVNGDPAPGKSSLPDDFFIR